MLNWDCNAFYICRGGLFYLQGHGLANWGDYAHTDGRGEELVTPFIRSSDRGAYSRQVVTLGLLTTSATSFSTAILLIRVFH